MLERKSALASVAPCKSDLLQLSEARGFSLTLASGISSVPGAPPLRMGYAETHAGRLLMRVGPKQIWIIGPEHVDPAAELRGQCVLTPLSHSRTRIALEGPPARTVLAKGIALDFHPTAFTPGMFAQTGLRHTPVLVHCVSEDRFEIYALRTFALTVWEWLTDAALEFAG